MLLTTREVATLLRVHPKHVYRLLRRGLPARRVGGEWRFLRDEVVAWAGTSGDRVETAVEPSSPRAAPLVLAANEDIVIDLLLASMRATAGPVLGRIPADSAGGLELLRARAVAVAGFHGGDPPAAGRLAVLHLFERELGLVHTRRRGAPALSDIGKIRFASRPEGAGSRVHLDAALRKQRLDPAKLDTGAQLLSSPREVACSVARGAADAGISTQAWASKLGLGFTRLVVERYALLIATEHLGQDAVVRLCAAAQSPAFAREVRGIPGCDPAGAGTLTFTRAG